jgi:hypothetical protein
MLWQGTQNVSLDVDTLLLTRVHIKQKAGTMCAETVNAVDSLWMCVEITDHESWSALRPVHCVHEVHGFRITPRPPDTAW